MNEIYKRRSIRSYTDEAISDDIIKKILKAGMNAPSAMNKKPWEFVVVKDRELLTELSKVTDYSFMVDKCNAAIIVVGKEETVFWQQDLAASTQNILLEATSNNVSSCWIGIAPKEENEEKVRNILNIPNDYRVLNIISLGYTDKEKESNNIYDDSKVHYETFN